jgi:hypothetical protein
MACAGFLLGLVFLTKAEVFFASFLAAGFGMGLASWSDEDPRRRWLAVGAFMVTAIIPPVVAFVLLRSILPTHDVLLAMAGSWRWLGDQRLLNLRYFRLINGTDHLGQSLLTTALWTVGYVVTFILVFAIGMRLRRPALKRPEIVIISSLIAGLVLWFFWMRVWENFLRPMQFLVAGGGIHLLWRLARERRDRSALAGLALPMMLVVFSGTLLTKIIWNVRAVHYGFALALPATVLVVNTIVYFGARLAESRGGSPNFVRGVWAALILVGCYAHGRVDYEYFKRKDYVVSSGGDAFLADIRGKMINEAAEYLMTNTRPDQTVLAMPEGFLLNYLARRVNPTIYHQFTPPNLIMYGEDNMLAELQKHPPDIIALVHVDNIEYDARFLGKNYGLKIWDWVFANYQPMLKSNGQTALFGYPPFVDQHSGVLLVERKKN